MYKKKEVKRYPSERSFQSERAFSVKSVTDGDSEFLGVNEMSSERLDSVFSRTSLLIYDYNMFLAARLIQATWRGFCERLHFSRRRAAVIVIQKWWRVFQAKRWLFRHIEERLQKSLLEHYERSAIKIQALYRGWWTRENIHDMRSLKRIQTAAAEDLLHCVAYKLHHLMRTFSIPGVYSLRNTHCLSRVEKLLGSLNFRYHNDRVQTQRSFRDAQVRQARERFKESKFATEAPYHGPNYSGLCEPHCDELFKSYDADKRMYRIIALYEEASRKDEQQKKIEREKRKKTLDIRLQNMLERVDRMKHDFCGDVIESMKRWKIWDAEKLQVSPDIFCTPKNVESFLQEISSFHEAMNVPCHCKIKKEEHLIC